MKIVQAFTIAALLAGSSAAASAETSAAREHLMRNYKALVTSSTLNVTRPAEARSIQLEEPAISPNGIPALSDFAAHR